MHQVRQEAGTTRTVVATIPTEDVIVESSVGYVPQYVTDVYGKTARITKDVTVTRLLNLIRKDFPDYELVSIGTPVNFELAPTHLSRVEMHLDSEEQIDECLRAISVSDQLIRTRVQPAWDWNALLVGDRTVILHVTWYDTVYFMQFKDVFLGELHCRYSAKFGFEPKDAKITHFRYTDSGDLEEIVEYDEREQHAESVKDQVRFLRVFRDGGIERT